MTDPIFWGVVDAICRLAVALVVIVKLTQFHDKYRVDERIGLGIAGGCAFMSALAPTCEWAHSLFAAGVMIYFIGRLRRQYNQFWSVR